MKAFKPKNNIFGKKNLLLYECFSKDIVSKD